MVLSKKRIGCLWHIETLMISGSYIHYISLLLSLETKWAFHYYLPILLATYLPHQKTLGKTLFGSYNKSFLLIR